MRSGWLGSIALAGHVHHGSHYSVDQRVNPQKRCSLAYLLVGFALAVGCGRPNPQLPVVEPVDKPTDCEWVSTGHDAGQCAFARVELERTECYGPCPVYTISLGRDGQATFHGGAFADREGQFTGAVPGKAYLKLCCLLQEAGIPQCQAEYGSSTIDDISGAILRIWPEGATEPIVIRDYGNVGPVGLWAVRLCIDGIAKSIVWKPAS